jgi:hypothetical protein
MVSCYDLNKSPATHDYVNWLVRVDLQRRAKGEEFVDIRLKLGSRKQSPRDMVYTDQRKVWRVHNLLIPLTRCLPSARSIEIGEGEQDLGYLNFPRPVSPVLKAPQVASNIVAAYLRDKPNPVSITIRQSEFEAVRNSNVQAWREVARSLSSGGYTPIWIPDGEALMLGNAETQGECYTPAAMSPEIRLALYEQTVCNLMTTGGPMVLALMSEVPMMAWKLIIPSLQCCTQEHMAKSGMTPDSDWGPYKRLYWAPDQANVIIRALEEELPRMAKRQIQTQEDVFALRNSANRMVA